MAEGGSHQTRKSNRNIHFSISLLLSLFYICLLSCTLFSHRVLSLHSVSSPFCFYFLSFCDILFLFHSPFHFHFLLCFTLCYFPLSRLISFPYFAFFLLHCLSISSSFPFPFLIPLLSSCLTSSHLLSFFVAFWSLVSPYLLFILICLSLSHSLALLLLMFSTFLFPFSYLVSFCLISFNFFWLCFVLSFPYSV